MNLVSYSGPRRADVDFAGARKVQFRAWQQAANAAVKAKEDKPPKPNTLRADTLYLKPGSTAMVSDDELAVIRKERPDVARYLQVHEDAPDKPRSVKDAEANDAKAKASAKPSAPEPPAGDKPDAGDKGKTKRAPKPK